MTNLLSAQEIKAGVIVNYIQGEGSFSDFSRQKMLGFSVGGYVVFANKIGIKTTLNYLSTQPYNKEVNSNGTVRFENYKMSNVSVNISPSYNFSYKKTTVYVGFNFSLGVNTTHQIFYMRWESVTDPADYFNDGNRKVNEVCVSYNPMFGVRQDLGDHLSLDIGLDFYKFHPIPIPFANTVLYENPQISTCIHVGILYNFVP